MFFLKSLMLSKQVLIKGHSRFAQLLKVILLKPHTPVAHKVADEVVFKLSFYSRFYIKIIF